MERLTIQDVELMGSDNLAVFDYAKDVFTELSESDQYKLSKTFISDTHPNPCGLGLLQKRSN